MISFENCNPAGQPSENTSRIAAASGRHARQICNSRFMRAEKRTANGMMHSTAVPSTVAIAAPTSPYAGVPGIPGNPSVGIPASPKMKMNAATMLTTFPAIAASVMTFGRCNPKNTFESALPATTKMPPTKRICAYERSIAMNDASCPITSNSEPATYAEGSSTSAQYASEIQSPAHAYAAMRENCFAPTHCATRVFTSVVTPNANEISTHVQIPAFPCAATSVGPTTDTIKLSTNCINV